MTMKISKKHFLEIYILQAKQTMLCNCNKEIKRPAIKTKKLQLARFQEMDRRIEISREKLVGLLRKPKATYTREAIQ